MRQKKNDESAPRARILARQLAEEELSQVGGGRGETLWDSRYKHKDGHYRWDTVG